MFCCAYIMLYSFLFCNMVLLSGVEHMHHTLNQYSNYRKKQSGLSLFSLVCRPLFLSSKILNFSNSLRFLSSDYQLLFLILSTKLHLVAFIIFSYSIHLFINIPQDRPVKVIYIYSEKTVLNMVLNRFVILVLNSGILYLWNSVMLHLKYHLKQK